MDIEDVISEYFAQADVLEWEPFQGGHINSTFKITRGKDSFILQKINENVFKEPEKVMNNLLVTANALKANEFPLNVLKPIKSLTNKYYVNQGTDYWRLFPFYSNAYTPLEIKNNTIAYEAARAYGLFDRFLKDVNIKDLSVTISDFYNFEKRYAHFAEVIRSNPVGRVAFCPHEIENIIEDEYIITEAVEFQKKIKERPIHGDAKSSNVMLSKYDHSAYVVIDLDTLMPGHILYDFGDMVRSFTSSTHEDSDQFDQTYVKWEVMEALCKGFLSEVSPSLSNDEWDSLIPGSAVVTYVQAIRFLADYIEGDVYYQTKYPDHNLVRAKNQIKLYKSIVSKKIPIERLVESYR